MNTLRRGPGALFAGSLFALALAACGASVAPIDSDGGADGGRPDASSSDGTVSSDAPVEPPGCVLPDGTRVPIGASTVAPDGCNTCTCQPSGAFACTELACVDASVPEDVPNDERLLGACVLSSECAASEICVAPPGCGTPGSCQPAPPCTDDIALYCMCNGATVSGSSSCPPGIFLHRGPCEISVDAGTDSGVDASVDSGVVPGSVDCNANAVACASIRPVCPPGMTNSIVGRCWGPCVSITACQRLACTPMAREESGDRAAPAPAALACPQNMFCDPSTSTCVEDTTGG